jgi:hypothetical protein
MLKSATTLALIYALLTVFLTGPVAAQTQSELNGRPATVKKTPDLKKAFREETLRYNAETASVDSSKMNSELLRQQQPPKKGWSKTQKGLLIAAIAVGVAACLFVAIKYGKNCLRTDPENCTLGTDEPCTCVEYERRIPEGK